MGSTNASKMVGDIDRQSGVPIYVQLREILRAHIAAACPPGSALPSERDLAERFGLARMTVRQAIDALVGEEVIERVVGLGTFVRKPKLDLQVKLTSYSEEMQRRGMVPAAKVLSFEQIGASAFLARELQLEEGTPLVRFRRLLLADNEPMSVDENFIPAHRVPGLLDGEPPTSLYNVLSERYGLVMEWGEDMIEATAASPSTARLLNVEVGTPLLKIQRHAFVARAMVDYSVSYYRADRYKLWVPLQRPASGPPGTTPRGTARSNSNAGRSAPVAERIGWARRGRGFLSSGDAERPGPRGTGPSCVTACLLPSGSASSGLSPCFDGRGRRGGRGRPPAQPEWPGQPGPRRTSGTACARRFSLRSTTPCSFGMRGQRRG